MSSSRVKIFALLGALVLSLAAVGCGGDNNKTTTNPNSQSRQFNTAVTSVNADRFAGPAPLSVNFVVKTKKDAGPLSYRWRFDDGTSSTEQNPSHTFPEAGYYLVLLDVHDLKGQSDRQSLLLGSWPPKQWAKAQSGQAPPSPRSARSGFRRCSRRAPTSAGRRRA